MKAAKERHQGLLEREIARDIDLVEPELKPVVKKLVEKVTAKDEQITTVSAKKGKKNADSGMEIEL